MYSATNRWIPNECWFLSPETESRSAEIVFDSELKLPCVGLRSALLGLRALGLDWVNHAGEGFLTDCDHREQLATKLAEDEAVNTMLRLDKEAYRGELVLNKLAEEQPSKR